MPSPRYLSFQGGRACNKSEEAMGDDETDEPITQREPTTICANLSTQNTHRTHRRCFGAPRSIRQPRFQTLNADDYELKYPDDPVGEEMGSNARFYRAYIDEHDKLRSEMVEGWRDNLDVLLVFAGLFSAVVTTIVVEASKNLQPDYAELTTALLVQQSAILSQILFLQKGIPINDTLPPPINTTFSVSNNARWVNGLWFTSLALSLATALIAVIAKQWLHNHMTSPTGVPQARARLLHIRYLALKRWRVSAIIGLLPFLIHFSLLLFFCGLVVYLVPLDRVIGVVVGSVALTCYLAYLVTTILSLFHVSSPYKTSLSHLVFSSAYAIQHTLASAYRTLSYAFLVNLPLPVQRRRPDDGAEQGITIHSERRSNSPKPSTLVLRELALFKDDQFALNTDAQMIMWMYACSFSPSATSVALQALCNENLPLINVPAELIAESIRQELEMYMQGTFKATAKLDRLIRTLNLPSYRAQGRWLESTITPIQTIARNGILLQPTTWALLAPLFGGSIFWDLAMAISCPHQFQSYWQDSSNCIHGLFTIFNLLQDKDLWNGKAVRTILKSMCRNVQLRTVSDGVTRNAFELLWQELARGNRRIQTSHLQIMAFYSILFRIFHANETYAETELIDALEELTYEVCKILQDVDEQLSYDGCTSDVYLSLLADFSDWIGYRVPQRIKLPSRFKNLCHSTQHRILSIHRHVQEQVALYVAKSSTGFDHT